MLNNVEVSEFGMTADMVWLNLLDRLFAYGKPSSPRGQGTLELLGAKSVVNMQFPVITVPGRRMGYKFMCAEAWWILSGRSDVDSIAPYSKAISKFSNDGYRFDGAYGPMIMEQMRYVVDSLTHDLYTRQAVITIWRQNPRESRDIPCTVSLQFLVRDNHLHCMATMRSSDAWLGWVYDVFNFSMISYYVLLRLRARGIKELKIGNLVLTAGSQHIYDINEKAAERCVIEGGSRTYEGISIRDLESPGDLIYKLSYLKDNPEELWNWINASTS